MKRYGFVFALLLVVVLVGCSQEASTDSPDISSFLFATEDYEDVNILEPATKTLYIYFTGID